MAIFPAQAADAVYAALAPSLTPEALRDYGCEPTDGDTAPIWIEIVALNLYWAETALRAALQDDAQPILDALERRMAASMTTLVPEHAAGWLKARARAGAYEPVGGRGGGPIEVFQEAADYLEDCGALEREARQNFLAFCLDFIPVDTFGELAQSFEVEG